MLTVHHLNNSRSPRILWLLEELTAGDSQTRSYRSAEADRCAEEATASLRASRRQVVR
jgi:hypothetical protein